LFTVIAIVIKLEK